MTNELIFAKELENKYLLAKKQFKHPNITGELFNLKSQGIDFNKLKIEVEKLGYHLALAEDIDISYWQEQAKLSPCFIFFATEDDL